jgi:hypothetical protein
LRNGWSWFRNGGTSRWENVQAEVMTLPASMKHQQVPLSFRVALARFLESISHRIGTLHLKPLGLSHSSFQVLSVVIEPLDYNKVAL